MGGGGISKEKNFFPENPILRYKMKRRKKKIFFWIFSDG
jgi:hypothetical protein